MFILRSRGLEKDVKGIVVLNGVIFVGLIAVQEWVWHYLRGLNRPRITGWQGI